jgi:hypothetical protein
VLALDVPTVREESSKPLTLLREDAASLVVLFVLELASPTVIAALMVVGEIPGVVGGF